MAVSRSASPQIPLNEIRPLERPSPPPRTSDRRAPALLHAGAGTRVGLRRRAAPRASFCKEAGKTGKENALSRPWPAVSSGKLSRPSSLGFPSHAGLRAADAGSSRRGGSGCRSRTAPSPAPPAAATSPLQLAAWLFCLIKLNVSVNFPPGRAALPLPEPECWLQMSTRPIGAAPSPWRLAAPATRGHGRGFLAVAVGCGAGRGQGPDFSGTHPGHRRLGPAWARRVGTHSCDMCRVKSCPCVS